MSDPPPAIEPLWESTGAVARAIDTQGWSAAAYETIPWLRLAGWSLDERPWLVSELGVYGPSITVHTRLPLCVPPPLRHEAALLVSSQNASGGSAITIHRNGVPLLISKIFLYPPEEQAVATIVHGVRWHREWASIVHAQFRRLLAGETAQAIATELELEDVPFTKPYPVAALFDLSHAPPPRADNQPARPAKVTDGEWSALLRLFTLNEQQPNGTPFCAGPVVTHTDGVLECYACHGNPETRIHPGGTTASCSPHGRVGYGHVCDRCGPAVTRTRS